ncbi:DUF636 domain protein [Sistotremastrum suecicum HHB10207 ss-3]|uniref:DUF636 domain protein n=1 Tax=Sistotremastrum suecicum HHB10207 ss-3 TaxID=1314776 RepID=A0A166GRN0_9AGAM|nr:DUF636 domain protein [Sistotremastrum suecicum HHB10207 ss-3]
MTIKGYCLCGQVVIEAEHQGAGICHCDSCRRGSGSAYSLVIEVPTKALTISGPYKEFIVTGASGKPSHRIFCPNCGSQIANQAEAYPDITWIKAGTLDYEVQKTLKPDSEVFTSLRLPYIQDRAPIQRE